MPIFESPSSIPVPRPKLESHGSSTLPSDAGSSTLSASRQKQSKRDEVSIQRTKSWREGIAVDAEAGNSEENGGRSP